MSADVVIFDLEFTAWPGSLDRQWAASWEHWEVVEIGAIRLDAASLVERGRFSQLVRPRINGSLSPYFQHLTGITQAELMRDGRDAAEAFPAFAAFSDGAPLWCYGRDDLMLNATRRLYGLAGRVSRFHAHNLRPWLAAQGVPGGISSGQVAEAVGCDFDGAIHRALDDARSLAAGVARLTADGAPSPFSADPKS
jgi:inhibitor of KinA sporulation pathway (predicted exonuclease)